MTSTDESAREAAAESAWEDAAESARDDAAGIAGRLRSSCWRSGWCWSRPASPGRRSARREQAEHVARTAADLGALAGAVRAVEGREAACGRAAQFVAANGGRLTSCHLQGLDIVIEVEVAVTPLPGLTRRATAAARAGPITAPAG
nr:hypothetical protein GCM10020092_104800 [Actinoplanes digitatis]